MKRITLILSLILAIVGGCNRPTSKQQESRESSNTIPIDGERIEIPAVGLSITKPRGFIDATTFNGFQDTKTGSYVLVTVVPGDFSKMAQGFTADLWKTRGITILSTEQIELDGLPGTLFRGTQFANNIDHVKWIVVFGDKRETKIITAACPKDREAEVFTLLKSVVLSARLSKQSETIAPSQNARPKTYDTDTKLVREPSQTEPLVFSVDRSEKMKRVADVAKIGPILAYSNDGVFPVKSPKDPLFIAAAENATATVDGKRRFAAQRLLQLADTKLARVMSHVPVEIDGLDGFEAVADATTAAGVAITVFQVILFDEDLFFVMHGRVGAEARDDYVPEFRAMSKSFKRKRT